ncbi:MAG: glycosyltransferase family 2 protein [Chitinophagales bacterium]
MIQLSVVVPVYNEAGNIAALCQRVSAVAQDMGLLFEIILVNDGSVDGSLESMRAQALIMPEVKYIDLSRNFGQQLALTAGLEHSLGEYVVIMDADLQDPPEVIADLYARMKMGFDVVYAQRLARPGESMVKRGAAALFYRLLSSITNVPIPVDTGDFRMMSRRVVNALMQMPERHKYYRGQVPWLGFSQSAISYTRNERHSGTSGYSNMKMLRLAIDGITSFSTFPLRIASIAGFMVSGMSFIWILIALYDRLIAHNTVRGWTSLMIAVLFLGGIQLICLGVIGEYMSRISDNVRNRPLYIIREKNF